MTPWQAEPFAALLEKPTAIGALVLLLIVGLAAIKLIERLVDGLLAKRLERRHPAGPGAAAYTAAASASTAAASSAENSRRLEAIEALIKGTQTYLEAGDEALRFIVPRVEGKIDAVAKRLDDDQRTCVRREDIARMNSLMEEGLRLLSRGLRGDHERRS